MTGRARTERTPQRMRALFLKELARRGNVSDAARKAGVGRRTVYEWRDAEPAFAADWDEALETAIDRLESEAWRRAAEGTKKPIVGRVGKGQDGILKDDQGRDLYLVEYSDSLMTTLLKAHRPGKYRDRVDVTQEQAPPIDWDRVPEAMQIDFLERRASLAQIVAFLAQQRRAE